MGITGAGGVRAVKGYIHVPGNAEADVDFATGVVNSTDGVVGDATNGNRSGNAVDQLSGDTGVNAIGRVCRGTEGGQCSGGVENAGSIVADGNGIGTEIHFTRVSRRLGTSIDQQLHRIGHDIGVIQGGTDVTVETS